MSSEKTFGSRLENARALVRQFAGMPTYSAHVPELDPAAFSSLVADAEQKQRDYANVKLQLAVLRDRRKAILNGDAQNIGLLANLRNIRASIVATFGKTSVYVEKATELIRKMRTQKAAKTTELDANSNEQVETGSISRNTMSYGSIAQNFEELVLLLVSLGARYQPSATHLQINVLQNTSAELSQENANTQAMLASSKILQNKRNAAFKSLSERFQLIKAHILASFGAKSAEYKNIAKLSV